MKKKKKPSIKVFDSFEALKADRVPRELTEEEKERQLKMIEGFSKAIKRVPRNHLDKSK